MTVYPGIVKTRFREHVLAGTAPEQVSAIQRVITPEELAKAIVRGVERRRRSVVLLRSPGSSLSGGYGRLSGAIELRSKKAS
jgi:short-subunit dehydrogenase